MDNLTIMCDEISYGKFSPKDGDKETKTNFNEKKAACKRQNFYYFF